MSGGGHVPGATNFGIQVPRFEVERTGFRAVIEAARWDLVDIAFVGLLLLAAIGVSAATVSRYLDLRAETAALAIAVARAGEVEAMLASFESRIAACEAEIEGFEARVPRDLRLAFLESGIDYKAKELGLEQVGARPWTVSPISVPLGAGRRLEVLRHDRTIDVRGRFKDSLALLAAAEALEELIAVRGVSVRRGATPGEVATRFEVSAYQLIPGERKP